MSLTFGTSNLKWLAQEGQNIIKITNSTQSRFAFKVKTSNYEAYATTPVADFIAPGFSLNLVVVRKKSPMKDDKLGISYMEVSNEETDALEVFKKPNATPSQFIVTMVCESK